MRFLSAAENLSASWRTKSSVSFTLLFAEEGLGPNAVRKMDALNEESKTKVLVHT
jgi:hypothetical protein